MCLKKLIYAQVKIDMETDFFQGTLCSLIFFQDIFNFHKIQTPFCRNCHAFVLPLTMKDLLCCSHFSDASPLEVHPWDTSEATGI